MVTPEYNPVRDAKIRRWIEENALELIRQSPLGVTLGLLVSGLAQMKNRDIRTLTEDGFYHRCHRVLSDMVEGKKIRKDGKQYFYQEPSDQVLAKLEDLIEHPFPNAKKISQKDLAPLRAALQGMVGDDQKSVTATRKPRGKKMGSQID